MILPTAALIDEFDEVALCYYNPNIAPFEEYEKRKSFVVKQAARLGVKLYELDYDHQEWAGRIDSDLSSPERCVDCYELRLERVAALALEEGFDSFASTLTISPYQDAQAIHRIGRELSCKLGVDYLDRTFSSMYYDSIPASKELGIYRQNYCGCELSKREADYDREKRRKDRAIAKQNLKTDDFDYDLPQERIAQSPLEERESCKMFVLDRESGEMSHRIFSDITEYIKPDDLLILNETRVLPARLHGLRAATGARLEVLLLKELDEGLWECLIKPGRKALVGEGIEFFDGETKVLEAKVEDEGLDGTKILRFKVTEGIDQSSQGLVHPREVFAQIGEMPLPPYIHKKLQDPEMYQTVFSSSEHSAAAPTAGLHFTKELLQKIEAQGTQIAKVRLDVGLDTFRPVKEDDPSKYTIHTEYYEVSEETVKAIKACKAQGGRVISVGTTATRALESAYQKGRGRIVAAAEPSSLFIMPGYEFGVVDVLITNFHVPRSTLMMLVSAFASREQIMDAYAKAIALEYRMLSFGDAMLIL